MPSLVASGGNVRATRLQRLSSSWIVRSATLNAGGSVLDYALLFGLTQLAAWPTPAAAMTGLLIGAAFNFAMNRRFAFADRRGPAGAQAVRYALGIGALLGLHATVLSAIVDRGLLPLIAAKPGCDLVILGAGQLLVLRLFVFAGAKAQVTSQGPRAIVAPALQPAD
jgi:putative flippase GtrA